MSDKPSYLGLLNAVSNAEGTANTYLRAWADVTPSADVRRVLLTVAAREGEHAASFAKRINELGYEVRRPPEEDERCAKAVALVTQDCSDLEKMTALKLHKIDTGSKPDIFDDFFKDHTIDIRTGELLGRYIAEERDSGRLLRSCYDQLVAANGGAAAAAEDMSRIDAIEAKVDAVCAVVTELRDALLADAASTNGSSKAKARNK
jgi:rubrerythrin